MIIYGEKVITIKTFTCSNCRSELRVRIDLLEGEKQISYAICRNNECSECDKAYVINKAEDHLN